MDARRSELDGDPSFQSLNTIGVMREVVEAEERRWLSVGRLRADLRPALRSLSFPLYRVGFHAGAFRVIAEAMPNATWEKEEWPLRYEQSCSGWWDDLIRVSRSLGAALVAGHALADEGAWRAGAKLTPLSGELEVARDSAADKWAASAMGVARKQSRRDPVARAARAMGYGQADNQAHYVAHDTWDALVRHASGDERLDLYGHRERYQIIEDIFDLPKEAYEDGKGAIGSHFFVSGFMAHGMGGAFAAVIEQVGASPDVAADLPRDFVQALAVPKVQERRAGWAEWDEGEALVRFFDEGVLHGLVRALGQPGAAMIGREAGYESVLEMTAHAGLDRDELRQRALVVVTQRLKSLSRHPALEVQSGPAIMRRQAVAGVDLALRHYHLQSRLSGHLRVVRNPGGDWKRWVKSLPGGKVVGQSTYFHVSALPDEARELVESVSRQHSASYALVKFDHAQPRVSLLGYPRFFEDAFPALLEAWTIDVETGKAAYRSYAGRDNPPILHRKELFLLRSHPQWAEFAALSAQIDAAGLLRKGETSNIGCRRQWEERLRSRGYEIVGHTLVAR